MEQEFDDLLMGDEDTLKGKFLIFSMGNEDYGIEIRHVTEIIGIQAITPVPELEEYVKGVINLRGKIIPVMDVRLRFKKPEREYDDRTCIIIIEIRDLFIGLIIDRVSEVVSISDEEIAAPPDFNKNFHNKYIKGIGKINNSVKLLLDCEKILSDDEIDSLSNIG
ncbi:MAG: chemotaxis protein CheW [Deltaproteobacteria bacterium]